MRIKFTSVNPSSEFQLIDTARKYDIVQQVYPSLAMSFDNLIISDIQSYTDNAKYFLNIYEVNFNRCYANNSVVCEHSAFIKQGKIQVFELNLNFNMDINFRLFQDYFVDYWKNDVNIKLIKPLVETYNTLDIAYYGFKSLFTSDVAKMVEILKNSKNMMCVKRGNKMIFAYAVDSQYTYSKRNDLLELFLNGVYEMVKVTSGRGNYIVPEDSVKKDISMQQWYDIRREKNKSNSKNKYVFVADNEFYY